ncbi:AAA+ superfamily predicted ATPase [Tenacibaculum maritimum]|uniref:AAA family ATPase n=1 Tax=Tenacibaculum maritimum TaxID=107401 RepID=UPI0012E4CD3B|nr:AAA family ATPase [Tenacibaculum maritimum]CAA0159823.1 AAA+ superfamily predicted ATPase [Tenacibaculum maritimum]CAA0217208.1 AAA+ superfamily predicted ATPase [Tenacibaculum maritimum]
MSTRPSTESLFEQAVIYPDIDYRERLNALVGLDNHKSRMTKILSLLINPEGIKSWMKKFHPDAKLISNIVLRRPPLVILEGDIGSGKTELATCIGDVVARQEGIDITLLPLSLSARGQGHVGEMTKLISTAFDHTIEKAGKLKNSSGKSKGALILLVDEADALTQSRESNQMHHEDKAGVNAFIRGIDRIANGKLPAAVIMCTNRLNSLDPAIKRRSADILKFGRPNEEQRLSVLKEALVELGFTNDDIKDILSLTGKTKEREYGFTFSDLTQRLLPSLVLDAYPSEAVNPKKAKEIVSSIIPTPPFQDNNALFNGSSI